MTEFLDAVRSGVRTAYCTALNNNRDIFGQFYRAAPIPLIGRTLDQISKTVCNRPTPDQQAPPASTTGGQCPGVRYNCVLSGTNTSGNPFSTNYPNRLGPITRTPPANPATCSPPQVANNFRWQDGNGSTIFQAQVCSPQPLIANMVCTPVNPAAEPPGGCGDGFFDGDYPPATPIETDINITYGDNNEFNLTTPIIFAPVYIALDGSINVPITIPDLDLVGELNLNGDFNIDLGLGRNRPPNTGNDDPIGDPDDEGGDPDDEEEDRRPDIVGVFVVVTSVPTDRATFIPQSAGPSIIAPRAGSVKFKVSADGRSGWSEDFPVKSSNAWIPVPGRLLATDVQVTPDFGSELTFRVVRERPEPA